MGGLGVITLWRQFWRLDVFLPHCEGGVHQEASFRNTLDGHPSWLKREFYMPYRLLQMLSNEPIDSDLFNCACVFTKGRNPGARINGMWHMSVGQLLIFYLNMLSAQLRQ